MQKMKKLVKKEKKEKETSSSLLKFKIILLGDSSTGKTTFFNQAIYNESFLYTDSTIGIEVGTRKVKFQNREFLLELWDMKTPKKLKEIPDYYIDDAIGAFILYDTTKQSSFEETYRFCKILKNKPDFVKNIMVLGNKIDLENLKAVKMEDLEDLCFEEKITGIEISALKGVSVDTSLSLMTKGILKLVKKVKGYIPYPENFVIVDKKKEGSESKNERKWGCQLV